MEKQNRYVIIGAVFLISIIFFLIIIDRKEKEDYDRQIDSLKQEIYDKNYIIEDYENSTYYVDSITKQSIDSIFLETYK
jgi:hypothetical protein